MKIGGWTLRQWYDLLETFDDHSHDHGNWGFFSGHDDQYEYETSTQYTREIPSLVRNSAARIHKFVGVDLTDPFHTHQADWAVRLILRGGYVEEVLDRVTRRIRSRTWRPGMIGIVRPAYSHRLVRLLAPVSISLWVYGGMRRHDIHYDYPDGRYRVVTPAEIDLREAAA